MNNKGKLWEIEAANYLRKHKYKLVDVNYTTRFGEIDLFMFCRSQAKKYQFNCFTERICYLFKATKNNRKCKNVFNAKQD